MKKVIITGANGFIGSSLVKKMIANNVKVIAVDACFSNDKLPQSDYIYRIESTVDEYLEEKIPADEYDVFFHLAWKGVNGSEKANPSVQLANIQMAVDCAKLCKKLHVKKLLCAGTVAENAVFSLESLESTSGGMMYGVAKHSCRLILESFCKNISVPFAWMQFSNIFGVGNKTGNLVSYALGELIAGKDASFGPALQPYDFIYIDDLIEAVYRLGNSELKKSFYYIGSGSPNVLKNYLIRIGELAGSPEKIRIGARIDDGIKYSMDMFDNCDLVKTIGDYVATDFDSGINKTIKWLKGI